MTYNDTDNVLSLRDIAFCALECLRQESGEYSVYNMALALAYLRLDIGLPPFETMNLKTVATLGELIDSGNHRFRTTPAYFADLTFALAPEHIERQLSLLLDVMCSDSPLSPEEFFQQFETIHPFNDGNGRVGALLFNFYNNTLDAPIFPPPYRK